MVSMKATFEVITRVRQLASSGIWANREALAEAMAEAESYGVSHMVVKEVKARMSTLKADVMAAITQASFVGCLCVMVQAGMTLRRDPVRCMP